MDSGGCINVMAHMNAAMIYGSLASLFAGVLIGAAIQRFVSRNHPHDL